MELVSDVIGPTRPLPPPDPTNFS